MSKIRLTSASSSIVRPKDDVATASTSKLIPLRVVLTALIRLLSGPVGENLARRQISKASPRFRADLRAAGQKLMRLAGGDNDS